MKGCHVGKEKEGYACQVCDNRAAHPFRPQGDHHFAFPKYPLHIVTGEIESIVENHVGHSANPASRVGHSRDLVKLGDPDQGQKIYSASSGDNATLISRIQFRSVAADKGLVRLGGRLS